MPLPTKTDAVFVRPTSIQVPPGMTELRHLRTENSKTHLHAEKSHDGKEIRTCEVRMGAVCYRDDDGQLRSIDTTIRDLDGEIGVDWAPYKFRLHSTGIGFDFYSRDGGWVGITLSGIGGEKFDQDTPLKPDIVDNTITFRDVRPGCDIVFKCLNQRVKTLRILHDENAPRTFDWTVSHDTSGKNKIDESLFGTDAAGNQLELTRELSGPGFGTYLVRETWTGKTKVILNPATRIRTLSDDVVYPVEIDPTVNYDIIDTYDDGYELTANGSHAGQDPTHQYLGGINYGAAYGRNTTWRWLGLGIPSGAEITSATLSFYVTGKNAAYGSGAIYGYKTTTPAQLFSGGEPFISTATLTTATTPIATHTSTGTKNYDVTDIVAEIVALGSWTSGCNLALLAFGAFPDATDRTSVLEDYSQAGGHPATLSVTYTAAAGGTAANLLLLGCG